MKKIKQFVCVNLKEHTNDWKYYWNFYGGIKSLFGSLYFWLAIAISIVLSLSDNIILNSKYETILGILPSLLGFSIAGLALFLSLFTGKLGAISGKEFLQKVTGKYVHFIVIQIITLTTLYIFYMISVDGYFIIFIVNFLVIYSILLLFAVTFAFLNLSRVIVAANNNDEDEFSSK